MEVALPTDIVHNHNEHAIVALSTRRGALPLKTALERTAGTPSELLVLKVPLLAPDPSLRRELRRGEMEIGSTFDGTSITNLYALPSDPTHKTTTELVEHWKALRSEEGNPIPDDLTVLIPHISVDLIIAALYATGVLPDGYSYKDLFIGQGSDQHPLIDLLQYAKRRTNNMTWLSQSVAFYLTRRTPLPAASNEPPSQEVLLLEQ